MSTPVIALVASVLTLAVGGFLYRRVLASWASDVLELRRTGGGSLRWQPTSDPAADGWSLAA